MICLYHPFDRPIITTLLIIMTIKPNFDFQTKVTPVFRTHKSILNKAIRKPVITAGIIQIDMSFLQAEPFNRLGIQG